MSGSKLNSQHTGTMTRQACDSAAQASALALERAKAGVETSDSAKVAQNLRQLAEKCQNAADLLAHSHFILSADETTPDLAAAALVDAVDALNEVRDMAENSRQTAEERSAAPGKDEAAG